MHSFMLAMLTVPKKEINMLQLLLMIGYDMILLLYY
jgi:hypothetical protein